MLKIQQQLFPCGSTPSRTTRYRLINGARVWRELEGILCFQEFANRAFGVINAIVELLSITFYVIHDKVGRVHASLRLDRPFLC
jgi:hypothetical protein